MLSGSGKAYVPTAGSGNPDPDEQHVKNVRRRKTNIASNVGIAISPRCKYVRTTTHVTWRRDYAAAVANAYQRLRNVTAALGSIASERREKDYAALAR